jgi:hypothetical protein
VSITEAATRLSAAGIALAPIRWAAQERGRLVDPRNPLRMVERQGVLLGFTGAPDNEDTNADHTVPIRVPHEALDTFDTALASLVTDAEATLTLPEYRDPDVMSMFPVRDGVILTSAEARWERFFLGTYRLPLTPELLSDLRRCLRAEAVLLSLSGQATTDRTD